MNRGSTGVRFAEVERDFGDLRARVVIDLDGGTRQDIYTGSHTLDRLLALMAHYGRFDLGVQVEGDIRVDDHAIVEIVGRTVGYAITESLKGSEPIGRFAEKSIVREAVMVRCALDAEGKGTVCNRVAFARDLIGDLGADSIIEFFRGICFESGIAVHFDLVAGENPHHICEAMFIAIGCSLHEATRIFES